MLLQPPPPRVFSEIIKNFPYPFPGVAEQPGEWLKEALPAQGLFLVDRSSTPSAET